LHSRYNPEVSRIDAITRARKLCADVGFDLDRVHPFVIERMRLLDEHSQTISDCERMAANAHLVFDQVERSDPEQAFTPAERRIVVLGCLFSDIGKTGPLAADVDGQRLIAQMFAVEGVRDEKQSVARFFQAHFPTDAAERLERFRALGLDPNMTMREFWNHHSGWTLEIAEAGGVPGEAIAAAAAHHLLEHVNPGKIVDEKLRFTRAFGDNPSFDRPEKLVILLDKYDAARRRSRLDHAGAIDWVKRRIQSNPDFRDDRELIALTAALDAALAPAS
jgi:hypothetical protein